MIDENQDIIKRVITKFDFACLEMFVASTVHIESVEVTQSGGGWGGGVGRATGRLGNT